MVRARVGRTFFFFAHIIKKKKIKRYSPAGSVCQTHLVAVDDTHVLEVISGKTPAESLIGLDGASYGLWDQPLDQICPAEERWNMHDKQ